MAEECPCCGEPCPKLRVALHGEELQLCGVVPVSGVFVCPRPDCPKDEWALTTRVTGI